MPQKLPNCEFTKYHKSCQTEFTNINIICAHSYKTFPVWTWTTFNIWSKSQRLCTNVYL